MSSVKNPTYPVTPAQAFMLLSHLSQPGRLDYKDVLASYKGPADHEGKGAASRMAAIQLTEAGVTRGRASEAIAYLVASRPTTPEGVAAKKARGLAILFSKGTELHMPESKVYEVPPKTPMVQLTPEELQDLVQQAVAQAVAPLQQALAEVRAQQVKTSKAPKAPKAPKAHRAHKDSAPAPEVQAALDTMVSDTEPATEPETVAGSETAAAAG